jgi:nucleoid-associated protein YgaU
VTRTARSLRLAAWVAGIALALVALSLTGHGALSPPPLGAPHRWPAWFEQRDPASAAIALVRMAAVGGCWYLAAVTVVGVALRLLRADVLVAIADRVTVAPIRRLLAGSLTLTLAGIGPTGMLAAAAQPAPPATSTSVTTSAQTAPPATVTMRRLPPAGTEPDAPAPPPGTPSPGRTWTVAPGECFWTIAADVLERAWGRPAIDAEIVPYWQRLIEANRSELADPGNADLIFPDQVFTLPAPPAADLG